ncbi:hypothetical protein H5410_015642 [Solanum commersonii]|uniref:Uncharacterized protein n=1 Tax=Solanum commersonii TaxID=4109 RepID=A0A9J5ZV10_SOLCO|nr:hypothetical protein H5410_015642 [Solanum commersonii]
MEVEAVCKRTRLKGSQILGLNNRDRNRLVKSLVVDWNADIMSLWGGRWVRFSCLEPSGTRGGILLLWDSRVWKSEILETGACTLTCKFEAQLHSYSYHITGGFLVYTLTRGKASYTLLMLCKIWRTLNAILGGEIGDLPSIYLGMPLGAKFLPSELWNSVIKKCGKKLARWKTQYLSRGWLIDSHQLGH